jgi:hypothetical protein
MSKFAKTWLIILSLFTVLTWGVKAGPPHQEPLFASTEGPAEKTNLNLSTPELIEAAFVGGEIDRQTADLYLAYALANDDRLPNAYRGNVPWRGTMYLLRLQESLKMMKTGAIRNTIQKILSGSCSSSSGSMANIIDTEHFHIEYNTIGGGLTIDDYTASLETTWETEIDQFSWAAPPVYTPNPAPGDRYHVRIDNLGSSYYGYAAQNGAHAGWIGDNPNTSWNEGDAYASCIVLNQDYSGFPGTSRQALDATTAHEFNHSIQFGYGVLSGGNAAEAAFYEGSATWMEDEVFDTANDNYNYLWPHFDECMGEYNSSPYPYWITFRGLTEPYGTGTVDLGEQIMQDFWEILSQSSTNIQLTALNDALVNKGTTLAEAYHAYAIAVKFNKPCTGNYTYPYCLEEGPDYVANAGNTSVHGNIPTIGNTYTGSVQDNYALNWISLPTGGNPYAVTLQNTSTGGKLRGSVVCDTGSTLQVNPLPAVVNAGETAILSGVDPNGCHSVIAVITNESQTSPDPSSCALRSYRLSTVSNLAPTISNLPDQFVYVNGSLRLAIDLWQYASDAQDEDADLTFTISNSPAISAGVTITANRYIDIMPIPDWIGSTEVEIQVEDTDDLTDTDTFIVTVSTPNTPPTIGGLPDLKLPPAEGSLQPPLDLWPYAEDAEDEDADLTFTISNAPVISAGVSITANRYVDIVPLAGWSGTTTVEIQVQDTGGLTDTDAFSLTVIALNTAPTISGLPNLTITNTVRQAINLWEYTDDDLDTPALMTYTISNAPVISAGVSITANQYIDIVPLAGWGGTTTVEIQVQDTGGLTGTDTFTITVKPNPTIYLPLILKNTTFN